MASKYPSTQFNISGKEIKKAEFPKKSFLI